MKSVCECQGSSEDYTLYYDYFPIHVHDERLNNDKLIVGNLGNAILRYASFYSIFISLSFSSESFGNHCMKSVNEDYLLKVPYWIMLWVYSAI